MTNCRRGAARSLSRLETAGAQGHPGSGARAYGRARRAHPDHRRPVLKEYTRIAFDDLRKVSDWGRRA